MLIKLAELKVDNGKDYHNTIIMALEKDGFKIIKELETYSESHYIIAKENEQ